jgi:hypothetical protein
MLFDFYSLQISFIDHYKFWINLCSSKLYQIVKGTSGTHHYISCVPVYTIQNIIEGNLLQITLVFLCCIGSFVLNDREFYELFDYVTVI